MAYEKNMKGSASRKTKEKETQPDYKGGCNINGTKYWQSIWINKGDDGSEYLSMSYEKIEDRTEKIADKIEEDNHVCTDEVPF